MARPALTTAAIQEFRDALCAVALRRFAEEGYRAVTLRGIARELGKSHALAYRYFANKEEIFVAVRLMCLERFATYQETRLDSIDDPAEAMRQGAQSYLDFAIEEPHAFRVMFDLEQPRASEYPALQTAHRRAFRILRRVIERAVAAGVLAGDPVALTRIFWASVHGTATLLLAGQLASPRAARTLAATTVEGLLAGFAPAARDRAFALLSSSKSTRHDVRRPT